MEHLFDWLKNPEGLIDYLVWHDFREHLSGVVFWTVLAAVVVILTAYYFAARYRRIQQPGDVFKFYTPLNWLYLSLAAGLVAAVLCVTEMSFLNSFPTKLDIAFEVFLITAGASALLAYGFILLLTPLTPARFRYRPAPFLYRDKAATR